MTYTISPPLDQRVVDDFFHLLRSRKTSKLAWFYGMLATYGVKPENLKGFTWNDDGTINVSSKKKPVRPMHPQWVFLFQLKEKQPPNLESCWRDAWLLIYEAMACKEVQCNVIELLLAYKMRKAFYKPAKPLPQASPVAAYA